jgi:AcrR family transcriptional regulator
MATTPDRRVRRTRAALRDALLDLMAERGYEAVAVQDIIERADVGRSTFYNHYADKDELLRDGLANLRSIVAGPAGPADLATSAGPAARAAPADGPRRALRFSLPLLRHVHEQRRLVRALLGRDGRHPVLGQIQEMLTGIVRAELLAGVGDHPARVPDEALARYVVGAYLALLEWWLTSAPELTPEAADRIFRTLVTPGLRAAGRPAAPRSAAQPH